MIPAFIKLSILINSFASWAISSSFGNLTPNATPLGISRAYVPPPIVLSGELSFVYFIYESATFFLRNLWNFFFFTKLNGVLRKADINPLKFLLYTLNIL